MNYKDEVIYFQGGGKGFIGKLQSGDHPNGPDWYRINEPCFQTIKDENGKKVAAIARLWGDTKSFRHFIDIRVPKEDPIEIAVLDKNGKMYETYQKELKRASASLIEVVGADQMPIMQ